MLKSRIERIKRRIKQTAKRAALTTLELMILVVIVATIVGSASGILASKLSNMSEHVDNTLTKVTDDIITSVD